MFQVSSLWLAAVIAMFISSSQAQNCVKYWTRAEAYCPDNSSPECLKFNCNKPRPAGTICYSFPLYYSLTEAQTGDIVSNPAKGRFSGNLPISTNKGTMIFDFFAGKDQIRINLDNKTGKAKITGGSGCYEGIRGRATRKRVGTTLPMVFQWKFCQIVKANCTPK